MSVSLWIALIVTYLLVAGSSGKTKRCLSLGPPNKVIWKATGESAAIPCDVRIECHQSYKFRWFVFNASSHHELNLKPKSRYIEHSGTLSLNQLSPNDSGIYVCAAENVNDTSGEQLIGSGTTVVMNEEVMRKVSHILLWLLFTLLAIYNLVLLAIIFSKKTGSHLKPWGVACAASKKCNSTKSLQFRCVVDELRKRRNLHTKGEDKGHKEEQPRKAEGTESNPSSDDIYQNL